VGQVKNYPVLKFVRKIQPKPVVAQVGLWIPTHFDSYDHHPCLESKASQL